MNILYVGNPGFPIGYAQVERQKLIAKGLVACGCDVTVINRFGVHDTKTTDRIKDLDEFENVKFIYATGSPLRPSSFIQRNFEKISGLFLEFNIIRNKSKRKKFNGMIITTNSIWNIVFYNIIGNIFGIPTILDNTEYWGSHKEKKYFKKLDGYLYDTYSTRLVDKVICISDYLLNLTSRVTPSKPVIKIPTIVDFSKFHYATNSNDKFFLYCGIASNYEIIEFVIQSFEMIQDTSYQLYLVSNGFPDEMATVKNRIETSSKNKNIRLFSALDYTRLIELYTTSQALLIPLRNTSRDFARFPHKVGEYCAAARAIISTNYGEVKSYFTDNVNALLADRYEQELFADKMKCIINNQGLTETLGQQSFTLGKKNFDYLVSGKRLYDFISLQ